jgi:hypothetical protein
MLFSTGRYPSTMGAGGQQDVEFCRYIEWVWFKRCVWLMGLGFAFGGIGLYIGYYYDSVVTEYGMAIWGVAWLYNGFLMFVLAVSVILSTIKALVVKAFVSPEVQVGQAATRTAQMMRKGGL